MKIPIVLLFGFGIVFSGPNQNAVLSVDLIPGSSTPDSALSMSKDNGAFWVAVRISQAVGLDSYGFEMGYDTTRLALIQTVPASPPDGLLNFLESLGGTPLGFISRPSQWDSTKMTVAHSLIGSDSARSPNGSGLLALFQFQPRGIAGDAIFTLGAVQLLDWKLQSDTAIAALGARLSLTTAVRIIRISHRTGETPSSVLLLAGSRDLLGRNRYGSRFPVLSLK